MLPQNNTKLINENRLKAVLNSMYYTNNPKLTSSADFGQLQLIKCRIRQLYHINVNREALREYVVYDLLTNLIQEELKNQRHIHNVEYQISATWETYEQAVIQFRQDTLTHSPILIGWSLLYYLYVHPDFRLSHNELASIVHIETRTLRRYKKRAICLLLQHIIRLEIEYSRTSV